MTKAALALCFGLCLALGARGQEDSSFVSNEKHETKVLTEPLRKGWTEVSHSMRFGAYGFSVSYRLDPATSLPSPELKWSDAFNGISGKKPEAYMSSNWSPWFFLRARIHVDGKDVPQPTELGKIAFFGLRESTPTRIVADAIWEDAMGGLLRARFIGWPGDRFGMTLKYELPAGKKLDSIEYQLAAQPYDLSDRGHWDRRRCIATPLRDVEAAKESTVFDAGQEWQFAFHNRFAQNTAGTFLAVDADSVAKVSVQDEVPMKIVVTPKKPAGETVLVLGDWVYQSYGIATKDFFASAPAVGAELKKSAGVTFPLSLPSPAEVREIDDLLARSPALASEFSDRYKSARTSLAESYAPIQSLSAGGHAVPIAADLAYCKALAAERALYQEIRSAWVTKRVFSDGAAK